MSKKIKAFISMAVTNEVTGQHVKFELFKAELFKGFVRRAGKPVQMFRLKIDGKWYEQTVQISAWEIQVIKFFTWKQFTAIATKMSGIDKLSGKDLTVVVPECPEPEFDRPLF